MSRCFPFPPPGYERKHRPEDLDILKEAKRKEKKHRKEKKDKERKKDREKKKDENDEKPRDKKDKKEKKGKHRDKKEKHKDKKKDKEDRSKDKDKSSISEESTVSGKLEKSGEQLHPKGYIKDGNSVVDEGKHSASFPGHNGEKASQSSLLPPKRIEESKLVPELDRMIRDDKGRGSQLSEIAAVVDKRDQEMAARIPGVLADEKSNNGKLVKSLMNESSGNTSVNNLTPIATSKFEGILRPLDGQNDKTMIGKEKHKETGDAKLGDKRRSRDKKSHGKEKDKDKEKKNEHKAKMKPENKKNKQERSNEVGKNDLVSVTSNRTYKSDLSKDVISDAELNVRKRKDTETNTNGFLHETEKRPNKLQRVAHQEPTENGRKLQAFQTPSNSSYENHAVPKPARLDNNDRFINGTNKSQNPSPSNNPNLSSAASMVRDQVAEVPKIFHRESISLKKKPILPRIEDQIAEPSKRPAHPDSKYLQDVLTVPTVSDWLENDDQEWLFSKAGSLEKKNSVGVKEEQCVWSKALYIDSVDVCALPYVIPY